MTGRISVIIPVYKVEAYLEECLDSVLTQDYRDLEVILIDDGSPDRCPEICDGYAARDSRVRVIHQQNAGAAAAKNTGLRAATGEYLSFVDSDDYLEPGAYSYMLSVLEQTGADAGEFCFRNEYKGRGEDVRFFTGREVFSTVEYLRFYLTGWSSALLWNKLYRRSLFDGIFFEEGHRIDDEYFTYRGMMNARKVVRDEKIIYHYRKRASGAMLNPAARERLMLDRVDFMEKRRHCVAERFPELKREFDWEFVNAMIYMAEYPDNNAESISVLKKGLKAYFRKLPFTVPPRWYWKGILRTLLTPTEQLLERCGRTEQREDPNEYFA